MTGPSVPVSNPGGNNIPGAPPVNPQAPRPGHGYPVYPDHTQAVQLPVQLTNPPTGATALPGYGQAPRAPQAQDPRQIVADDEYKHPDLADLRTRVPFNMPGLFTPTPTRSSRKKRREENARNAANAGGGRDGLLNNISLPNISLPGDPNAAPSFKELLSQPVSHLAAATIASPKELEDSDGLQFRAVGLAVGTVPEPDELYPIPYITREHPSYYTGYEIALIMESIHDPEHARQVLARIVAVPRWVRWAIALFGGVCGAAVSALNGFLSLLAFGGMMTVVLMFTYSFASRIGSGRFYDPTGYKAIWLGGFMPIGLLSAVIVARSVAPQPWLAIGAFIATTACGIFWTTWIQKFQIRRMLSSEIPDQGEEL